MAKATAKQIRFLEELGEYDTAELTISEASTLISSILDKQLATPDQRKAMKKLHIPHTKKTTKREASKLIGTRLGEHRDSYFGDDYDDEYDDNGGITFGDTC